MNIDTHRLIESLEPRVLLDGEPVLGDLANVTLLSGSPLVIPLNATDPEGGALTYTASSDDGALVSTDVFEDNQSLRITVTGFGVMEFQLFENIVPRVTEQIITLANDDFYNGVVFHRILDGFVIQGGDPEGTGSGGSTLGDFDDQFDLRLQHNRSGLLSMAKSTDDTNDSQFFITDVPTRGLDFNHSIFGVLTRGEDVRDAISNTPVESNGNVPPEISSPIDPVVMEDVEVFVDQANGVMLISAPEGAVGSTTVTVTVTDDEGKTDEQAITVTVVEDTVDGGPFLEDIPEIRTTQGDTASFTLSAIDPEGSAVFFDAAVGAGSPDFDFTIDDSTGEVVVTPDAGFTGELSLLVGVRPTEEDPSDTGGGLDFDTQTVTIFVDPLVLVSPISDVVIPEDSADVVIDLGSAFTDPGAGNPFTFIVDGNSNPSLVSTSIVDGMLTLSLTAEAIGTASLTVRATNDGGESSIDTFTVTVVEDNDPPVVEDQVFNAPEGAGEGTILGTVNAIDIDPDDVLSFAIIEGDDATALAINAATGEISIDDVTALGDTTLFDLTVQVTDNNGLSDTATITLFLDPPRVATEIADVTVDEDASDTEIDLSGTFDGPASGGELTLTITSNSNPSLVTSTLDGTTLTLSYAANDSGNALITIQAEAPDGSVVDDTFEVTVNAVDDEPIIEDQAFDAVAGSAIGTVVGTIVVDDSGEGDFDEFTITAGNEAGSVAIDPATGEITVAGAELPEGNITLTVQATDDAGQLDTATVTIDALALEVIAPIEDVTVDEDSDDIHIDLAVVFSNLPDTLSTTLTVGNNTDESLVTTSVSMMSGLTLFLDFQDNQFGMADITVRASTDGGVFVEDTFTVNVTSVNDAPVVEGQTLEVTSDGGVGALVTTVTANDIEDGSVFGFSITAGNEGGAMAIDPDTGEITIADVAALTANGRFDLTVQATDTEGLTGQGNVTVFVDPPTLASLILDVTVDEDAGNETIDLSDVFSDPPGGAGLTFTVAANTNAGLLTPTVVGSELTLDFRDNQTGIAFITIRGTSDVGRFAEDTFTVNVNAVNDAPTIEDQAFDLLAGSADGTVIGTVAFNDIDSGDLHSFVITEGNDSGALEINPFTGQITVADQEAFIVGTFNLTVRVTDLDGLTDTATVSITGLSIEVLDPVEDIEVDEDAPGTPIILPGIFTSSGDGGPVTFTLEENTNETLVSVDIGVSTLVLNYMPQASGTANIKIRASTPGGVFAEDTFTVTVAAVDDTPVIEDQIIETDSDGGVGATVGTVVATDADLDAVLTFAITGGDPDGAMAINPDTGEITVADAVKFSEKGRFDLTVRVTDEDGLFGIAAITVFVDPLTVVTPITDVSVDEDAAETIVDLSGVFSVPGGGNPLAFTVQSNSNDTLVSTSIDGSNLTLSYTPDANGTALITVRGTSTVGGFIDDTFLVTVSAANDAPVVEDQAFALVAGSATGALVGTVATSDPDTGDVLSFEITAGNDTGALAIDSSSGEITVADPTALAVGEIVLTVEVSDEAGLTDTAAVTVTGEPLEVLTEIGDVLADEDADNTEVDLSTTFTDAGDAGPVTITVETNTDETLVTATIVGQTLTIDYLPDANGTSNITVRASTPGGVFVEDTFTVTVAPLDDAPVVNDQSFAAAEDAVPGTVVGVVAATDPDADDVLSFAITAGNDDGALAIDSVTGELTVADAGVFTTIGAFDLTVEVTDSAALTDTASVVVDLIAPVEIDAGAGADDGFADAFVVAMDGPDLTVQFNGVEMFRRTASSIPTLTITGSGDDDTLTVSFAGGNPIPSVGLIYTGGGPGDNDTLVLDDGTVESVTHTFTAADAGTVDVDGSVITYTGLEPIDDNLDTTDRVFTFGEGADNITIRDNGTPGDGLFEIFSDGSGETVIFEAPTGSVRVDAGGGADSITVESLGEAISFNVAVDTGEGDDVVDVTNADFEVDVLDGGGIDTIHGGSSRVVRTILGTEERDRINVRQKGDEIQIKVNGVSQTMIVDSDNLVIEILSFGGADRINLKKLTVDTTVFAGDGNDTVRASGVRDADVFLFGEAGNDRLIGGDGADVLNGGEGNDRLIGGDGPDNIEGGAGNDRIRGGNGNDFINGGDGNDRIKGDDEEDTINGGAGNDRIKGGNGNDVLNGDEGDDRISGDRGSDTLNGGNGDDHLNGAREGDTLNGGEGDDILRGGQSNDFLIGGQGDDKILGQGGFDTVSYADSPSGVIVNLRASIAEQDGFGTSDRKINRVENITGSNFNDVLDGNHRRNVINGLDGTDILNGRGGSNDQLINADPFSSALASLGDGASTSVESSALSDLEDLSDGAGLVEEEDTI